MPASDQVPPTRSSQRSAPNTPSVRIAIGTCIDHFRVIRWLGEGGMGQVYLARDTKLGRKVALKILSIRRGKSRPHLLRFLMEARTTARFSHPNIVTIHAVGQYGQQPYLALEYLSGHTLSQRILEQAMSPQEALRIAEPIASALVEAHRRNILHLDLKPSNIIITRGGHLKILDFGLSQPIELEEALAAPNVTGEGPHLPPNTPIMGTPTYMAPEQWLKQMRREATDVWALGIILYQMVMGRRPFAEHENSLSNLRTAVVKAASISQPTGISNDLASLIMRCLQRDPDTRPSAKEVHTILETMLDPTVKLRSFTQNPFRGLRAFTHRQADTFFGRDQEIAEAVERLRYEPVLAVVGASGAGKSSLVQAGIGPRIASIKKTCVIVVRPGPNPFRTLASRILSRKDRDSTESKISIDPEQARDLASQLRSTPQRLSLVLEEIAETDETRVLLIVDQLEELYTLASEQDAQLFMQAIAAAADDPEDLVRVIFTVRDDFLSRVATAGAEVRSVLRRMMLVQVPEPSALTDILTKPVAALGYRYEDPALVDHMVRDLDGRPASLPLLQFAAGMLWQRRDQKQRLLTKAAYKALGGVAGALAKHADGVLDTLEDSEIRMARQILLRLVTPEKTRRIVSRTAALEGLHKNATIILDRLVESRLVSLVRISGQESSDTALELAHESLIHTWKRLRNWIEDAKEDLRFLAEVEQSATLWEKRGKRADEVWSKDTLAEAMRALKRCTDPVPAVITRFLNASQTYERRRRTRQRALLLTSFATLLSLSVIMFLGWQQALRQKQETQRQQQETLRQKQEALHQKQIAETRQAVAEREGAAAALVQGRMLEARAKLRTSLSVADSPSSRALWWRMTKEPTLWTDRVSSGPGQAVFSPDGKLLAVGMKHGPIHVYDVRTRQVRILKSHQTTGLKYMAFSANGRMLGVGSGETGLSWWSVADGQLLHEDLTVKRIRAVGFYNEDRNIAVTLLGGQILRWRVNDGVRETPYIHPGPPLWGRNSRYRDNMVLDGGFQGELRVTNLLTGKISHTARHGTMVEDLDIDPVSKRWVTAGRDGVIRFWSPTGEPQEHMPAGRDRPRSITFSPDGRWLAVGGYQGHLRILDATTFAVMRALRPTEGEMTSVKWSPDGRYLALTSSDRSVVMLDAVVIRTPQIPPGHRDNIHDVRFTPDGNRVITGSRDQSVRVFNAASGRIERVIQGDGGAVDRVALSQDGAHLAWASETVQLMDFRLQGTPTTLQERGTRMVNSVAFDPTGQWLAAVMAPRSVRIYDVSSRGLKWEVKTNPIPRVVHFSPDGTKLAVADRFGNLQIFSTKTRQILKTINIGSNDIREFQFDPTGHFIASVANNRVLNRWDVQTGKGGPLYQTRADIRRFQFSSDGTRILLAGSDGQGRLLDVASGQVVQTYQNFGPVHAVAFSPDNRWVATGSNDTTVMLFETETGRPRWKAPAFFHPQTLVNHEGWTDLDQNTPTRPEAQWAKAVTDHAIFAVEDPTHQFVCIATHENELQVWDRNQDRLLHTGPLEALKDLAATSKECVVLSNGAVITMPFHDGEKRTLIPAQVTALSVQQTRIIAAQTTTITAYATSSSKTMEPTVLHHTDDEVTAIFMNNDDLYLGFVRGGLHRISNKKVKVFESNQSFPITQITAGPSGTVLAGALDGTVGLWSILTEKQLYTQRLHGSVEHLAYRDGKAYVVSKSGAHLVWDLEAFEIDWCHLIDEVQQQVAVIWKDSRAVPQDHAQNSSCP